MATPARRPTPQSKRKRRRRRIISLAVYCVLVFALAWFIESRATTTIVFVRHADTDDAAVAGPDAPLNARGQARSELLADFLVDIDVLAGVDAIYVSEFRRTQQTARPLARRLGIEPVIADQQDIVGFMEDVLDDHRGEIALVVTHGDLIPRLVAELHGHQSVPEIGAAEYDNVYIVTIPLYERVKTLRFRYGLGWNPDRSYPLTLRSTN